MSSSSQPPELITKVPKDLRKVGLIANPYKYHLELIKSQYLCPSDKEPRL